MDLSRALLPLLLLLPVACATPAREPTGKITSPVAASDDEESGSIAISVLFVDAPRVVAMTTTNGQPAANERVTIAATFEGGTPGGSVRTFTDCDDTGAWSPVGRYAGASTQSFSFVTPPGASGECSFEIAIDDGTGASTHGTLYLNRTAPVVLTALQQ